ncbi:MAG: DUF5591 domain-containing protein [Candidatus Hodarchaeales archaeon]
MQQTVNFEIARQDGPGRIGKLIAGELHLNTPSLARSYGIHLKYAPAKESASLPINSSDPNIIITILPSWQFLGINPDENPFSVLQELRKLIERPKNAIQFVQLPQDAVQLDTQDKSPFVNLNAAVQDELSKEYPLASAQPLDWQYDNWNNHEKSGIILISLYNISQFLRRPKLLIEKLFSLHSAINQGNILFAPSVPPYYFPLLSYLGIDIFDASFAVLASIKSLFLVDDGSFLAEKPDPNCTCRACYDSGSQDLSSTLLKHNLLATENQINRCRWAIHEGKLWDLVRRTAADIPEILAAMRILKQYYDFLESQLPIIKPHQLVATAQEDLWRPEVVRYRHRIRERYSPPSNAGLCVILPCSAKKPYSLSKSHQRFARILKPFRRKVNLIELILTSPLGVVPRTLERIYPAASYDIPVTGDWSDEEQNVIRQAFNAIFDKFPSEIPILIHLKSIERSMLQEALQDSKRSIFFSEFPGSPHSTEALRELHLILNKVLEDHSHPPSRINKKYQVVKDTIDYQFGKGASNVLLDRSEVIKGKMQIRMQVFAEKKMILTYHADSGMTTLSWRAAEQFAQAKIHTIDFDGNELKGSTLFCGAISGADEKIRPGDEIIILNSDEQLVGIGRSILSSQALVELQRGPGVKIRHKRSPTED